MRRHAELVLHVARLELGVQLVCSLEVGDEERIPEALEAVAHRPERAAPVHPLA